MSANNPQAMLNKLDSKKCHRKINDVRDVPTMETDTK